LTVDIIIMNYNLKEFTKLTLKSLYKNTTYPFRVILLDNASTEANTKKFLKECKVKYKNLIVHQNDQPDKGFANGINIAGQYVENDYVLLLNNDIIIPKQSKRWLESLINLLEDKQVALSSCKMLFPNDSIQFAGAKLLPDAFTNHVLHIHKGFLKKQDYITGLQETFVISGALMCGRSKELLPLDENYLIGEWEDVQKSIEFLIQNRKLMINCDLYIYHYEKATQSNRENFTKYQYRNFLNFRIQYLPIIWKLVNQDPLLFDWNEDLITRTRNKAKVQGIYLSPDRRISLEEFELLSEFYWKMYK